MRNTSHVSVFSVISHLFWFFKAATVFVASLLLFCSKHYINIFTAAIKVTMKEVKEPMRPLITGGIDIFPKWIWICKLVAVANHWAVLQFWGKGCCKLSVKYFRLWSRRSTEKTLTSKIIANLQPMVVKSRSKLNKGNSKIIWVPPSTDKYPYTRNKECWFSQCWDFI